MGAALELVTATTTGAIAAFTAATAAAGNSLTVRNGREGSAVWLLQAWQDFQTVGTARIRSPKMHDNVQGIRFDAAVGVLDPMLPWGYPQRLFPQDPLTVELTSAGAVAGDVNAVMMLLYYADLPGVDGRFIDSKTLRAKLVHVMTVENTLALGVAGGYSGEEAINAEFDLWKANTDYALLGFFVDTEANCVRWRGADTGNLGVGGPAEPDIVHETMYWFVHLSDAFGIPLIPVFNSANRAGVLLDGAQDELGADTTVISLFAELMR